MTVMTEEGEVVAIPAIGSDDERVLLPFDMTLDEAAVVYSVASLIVDRLHEAGYKDKPYSTPLPRGFLSSGDALLLIPAVMVMMLHRHPSLLDPDVLRASLMDAALRHTKGKVN